MKAIAFFVIHTIALLAAITAVGYGAATVAALMRGQWRSAALGAAFAAVCALVVRLAGQPLRKISVHR